MLRYLWTVLFAFLTMMLRFFFGGSIVEVGENSLFWITLFFVGCSLFLKLFMDIFLFVYSLRGFPYSHAIHPFRHPKSEIKNMEHTDEIYLKC